MNFGWWCICVVCAATMYVISWSHIRQHQHTHAQTHTLDRNNAGDGGRQASRSVESLVLNYATSWHRAFPSVSHLTADLFKLHKSELHLYTHIGADLLRNSAQKSVLIWHKRSLASSILSHICRMNIKCVHSFDQRRRHCNISTKIYWAYTEMDRAFSELRKKCLNQHCPLNPNDKCVNVKLAKPFKTNKLQTNYVFFG